MGISSSELYVLFCTIFMLNNIFYDAVGEFASIDYLYFLELGLMIRIADSYCVFHLRVRYSDLV